MDIPAFYYAFRNKPAAWTFFYILAVHIVAIMLEEELENQDDSTNEFNGLDIRQSLQSLVLTDKSFVYAALADINEPNPCQTETTGDESNSLDQAMSNEATQNSSEKDTELL